jgi:hypothetical protein
VQETAMIMVSATTLVETVSATLDIQVSSVKRDNALMIALIKAFVQTKVYAFVMLGIPPMTAVLSNV